MTGEDFLRRLTEVLDKVRIPYMLSGSTASTFHGEPRSTNDLDLVVELDLAGVKRLAEALPPEVYYFDPDTARDAVRRQSLVNVIDLVSGWKADLIVRKRRRFSEVEFSRRQRVQMGELQVWMVSPEDVILAKLEWAKRSSSERQLRDVRGVIEQRRDELDSAYLRHWVAELELDEASPNKGERGQ